MIRKAPSYDPRSLELLDEPGGVAPEEVAGLGGSYPVWTENKAKFIHRYLRYFVFVTHHGTYIDGFAGPQEENHDHMWTAKLVLESEPKFLRNFYLCDKNAKQAKRLEDLKAAQPPIKKGYSPRAITVYHGDFNEKVDEVLASGVVTEKEATFALLDQRTFECDWQTVVKLATHKKAGNKIELLYFLPIKWLHRSISGLQKPEAKLDRWWGHDSWRQLANASSDSITKAFCDRVKSEFGYSHVFSWPIYANEHSGGAVMYQLVHASDHAEAPKLMSRAYRNANAPLEPQEQLQILFPIEDGVSENGTVANGG